MLSWFLQVTLKKIWIPLSLLLYITYFLHSMFMFTINISGKLHKILLCVYIYISSTSLLGIWVACVTDVLFLYYGFGQQPLPHTSRLWVRIPALLCVCGGRMFFPGLLLQSKDGWLARCCLCKCPVMEPEQGVSLLCVLCCLGGVLTWSTEQWMENEREQSITH